MRFKSALAIVIGVGALGVSVTDEPLELFARIDGILDFTVPAASIAFVELAAQARIVHVMGTTGFSSEDEQKIEAAARHATIVKAGNMSLGVNLLMALTKKVSQALDEDFDIEVLEMHHRHSARGRGADRSHGARDGRDGGDAVRQLRREQVGHQ
jgi:4-hydroxy-tetrahydrodipicolinate reductase